MLQRNVGQLNKEILGWAQSECNIFPFLSASPPVNGDIRSDRIGLTLKLKRQDNLRRRQRDTQLTVTGPTCDDFVDRSRGEIQTIQVTIPSIIFHLVNLVLLVASA